MPKSSMYRTFWQRQRALSAIRHPAEMARSKHLCISCTQTELPAAQQRRLVSGWCDLLPTLDGVRLLQFDSQVPQSLFDAACRMRNLEALWIKWSSIKSLEHLSSSGALRHLHLGSSAQIRSIVPLGRMPRLKSLSLQNIKRITDLGPLKSLTRLEELAISGDMWGHQKVKSLAPLGELQSLKWLHLGGVRSLDESLRPLDNLRRLRVVVVNLGEYPLEELAWLSVRFSKIDHGVRSYSDFDGKYSVAPCKQCRRRSMVLTFGKGRSRNLCQVCDADKLAAHIACFNDCVAACSAT